MTACDSGQIVQAYGDDVLSGKRVTGEREKAAVRRYQQDVKQAKKKNCPFFFDQEAADHALALAPLLKHSTGKFLDQPFHLEDWQVFILWNIFGWKRRADGSRRFRKFYIEIGRKNGKTALCALIVLICFVIDGESRPEIYAAATKRKQAAKVWQETERFIKGCPSLKSRIKVTAYKWLMELLADGGTFEALGGDGGGEDGGNPSLVIFDELHQWITEGHNELWDSLRTGSSTRYQPLFGVITTAGSNRSVLWKGQRKYADKVLSGKAHDDSTFVVIFAVDDTDDIYDERLWPKANPGLYSIKDPSEMRDIAEAARNGDPRSENQLKRRHLNRMVESLSQAIPMVVWNRGKKKLPALDGRVCHLAFDGGGRDDIAALAAVFPPLSNSGTYLAKCWGFIASECPRDITQEPFSTWTKQGRLIVTDGDTTDYDTVHSIIEEVRQLYTAKTLALDGNNARQFGSQLTAKGLTVYEHGQTGKHYNEVMKTILELLKSGRFHHGDDPLLSWAVGNMIAETRAGLTRPDKENSRDKIDPAVAMLMALSECLFHATRDDAGEARVRFL